jgi:large subunit ribosomal protein L13
MRQKYATRPAAPRKVKKQTKREKAGIQLPLEIAGIPIPNANGKTSIFPMSLSPKGKTTILTKQGSIRTREWYVFDAEGQVLGRFASEIAKVLRGKHRPDYTPNLDCGDGVVILNADKVVVTGMKHARKIYRRYTGFIGGLREMDYSTMMARDPEYILTRAIKGMMPKTRLGDQQVKKLRVYKSSENNELLVAKYKAQQPHTLQLA